MREKLTPEERETIILTSDADDTFEVYTFDEGLIITLRTMSERYPEHFRLRKEERDIGCATFDVFKPYLSMVFGPKTEGTDTGKVMCVNMN